MSLSLLLSCTVALGQVAPVADAVAVGAKVDELAAAHWQAEDITPAPLASDAEFLRRVTLDLIGRVPTPAEVTAFDNDRAADKRARVIAELMNGPEFAFHFGTVLDEIIQGEHAGDAAFVEYLRQNIAGRKSWDAMFREMIVGPWESKEQKPAATFLRKRVRNLDDLTNDTATAFFGVNVSCAKCHNHPLVQDWKQDHFYGMQSFFNRTFEDRRKKTLGEKPSGVVQFVDTKGGRHTAKIMFLSGEVIEPPAKDKSKKKDKTAAFSPRRELVEVALRERTFFSQAIVNHLWAYFTGRGLVSPVDQMHTENPPSIHGLLSWLAEDLVDHKYDLHRLVAGIVNSRVYQLSTRWESEEEAPEPQHFARGQLRPLSPMQYAASVLLVTDEAKLDTLAEADARRKFRQELEGRASRLTALLDHPGEEFQSSVGEALFMSNNPAVQELTKPTGQNLVARLLAVKERSGLINQAVFAVHGRASRAEESEFLGKWLETQPDRQRAVRDLVWALFTSAEFRFNH